MTQTSQYLTAQTKSYAGQKDTFSFPLDKGIVEQPLGFQPLGIAARGDLVAIAAYFEPAVLLAKISFRRARLDMRLEWIRGTIDGTRRVRMFPDTFEPGGANRMQSVVIFSENRLGLLRNGDSRLFVIERNGDEWHHDDVIDLPVAGDGMIHSIMLEPNDELITVESHGNMEHWVMLRRTIRGAIRHIGDMPKFWYGVARLNKNFLVVPDFRAEYQEEPFPGRGHKIVKVKESLRSVHGNGIALLNQGNKRKGALVTRYGQGHPGAFNGVPGALLYMPHHLIRKSS